MASILTLEHVTKTFGGLTAINDVSLEVAEGQVIGIIGPNGAGKSTLFNTVCGICHPNQGHIFFEGKAIEKLQPHQVCQRGIGRTFQLTEVFRSMTALECVTLAASLRLPLGESRKVAAGWLEKFGLLPKANWRCEALTPVDLKLIELAKAMATQPRLILLDEVMAGLTHVEAEPVVERIRHLPKDGITVVIVEHGMHIIKAICDRVVVLNFGSLIADGICDAVLCDKAVIDAYLGGEIAVA